MDGDSGKKSSGGADTFAESRRNIINSRLFKRNIVTLSQPDRGSPDEVKQVILRPGFACNQKCGFCYNLYRPKVEDYEIEWVIDKLLKAYRRIEMFSFSGGEPGLNQRLPEYIGMLSGGNIGRIDLQTNAVFFAKKDAAERLASAGLDSALAALHGHTAELSDAVTGAPGTFEKTVAGIRNLIDAGIEVHINHVVNPMNYQRVKDFVKFAAEKFPGTLLCISVAQPFIFFNEERMAHVPRLSAIAPHLREALDWCNENGVDFSGLHEACGVPLCVLDADERYFKTFHRVPTEGDANYTPDPEFVKVEKCRACDVAHLCFGVRAKYVECFGADEIKPVKK